MATPTVFVSSTFYDLRILREGLKRFIEAFGYIPVLSEHGTVFYDPKTTAAESCLAEVPNADMLILLIGGRFGSNLPGAEQSITNAEYEQAIKEHIPVFAFVDRETLNEYQLYQANVGAPELLAIRFPHADSVKIFEFIDQVTGQSVNNALVPFSNLEDIERHLRQQWAGLMHSYLNRDAEQNRVANSLDMLTQVNQNIEAITAQILGLVGEPRDKVAIQFLQRMLGSRTVTDLRFIGCEPSPGAILMSETPKECAEQFGEEFKIDEEQGQENTITSTGTIGIRRWEMLQKDYQDLRDFMQSILKDRDISMESYLDYETTTGIGVVQPSRSYVEKSTGAELLGLKPGDRVRHDTWGEGVVRNVTGIGARMQVTVDWESVGEKHMLATATPMVRA